MSDNKYYVKYEETISTFTLDDISLILLMFPHETRPEGVRPFGRTRYFNYWLRRYVHGLAGLPPADLGAPAARQHGRNRAGNAGHAAARPYGT